MEVVWDAEETEQAMAVLRLRYRRSELRKRVVCALVISVLMVANAVAHFACGWVLYWEVAR